MVRGIQGTKTDFRDSPRQGAAQPGKRRSARRARVARERSDVSRRRPARASTLPASAWGRHPDPAPAPPRRAAGIQPPRRRGRAGAAAGGRLCGMWPTSSTSRVSPASRSARMSDGSGRLQAAHHREGGQRVARLAERLSGLARPQLAAVPDLDRRDATLHQRGDNPPGRRAARLGQRPLRVDARRNRLAVVDQVDHDPYPSIPRQCAPVQTSGRSRASTVTTSRRPIHMAAMSVSLLAGCSPA